MFACLECEPPRVDNFLPFLVVELLFYLYIIDFMKRKKKVSVLINCLKAFLYFTVIKKFL